MRRISRIVAPFVFAAAVVTAAATAARGATINVATFGAISNDGINDATAINSAIASAAAGDTVQLGAGTYDLATTLTVGKSGLTLRGIGTAGTTLRRTGTASTNVLSVQNVSDVELTAFTLDGNNSTNATNGIYAATDSNLNLHDLAVSNLAIKSGLAPHGILFANNVVNSFIANTTFSNIGVQSQWGAGVRISTGSNGNQILNNTITNTGRGGILCDTNSTDLVIRNNTVTGSGQNDGTGLGIEVYGGCDRAVVESNSVDHWISVDASSNLAVRNNVISDHTGVYKYAGLELVDAHDDVFTGNVIDGGQKLGISISGANPKQHVYWGHNTFSGASTWGVQIQGESGGASDMTFYKNVFQTTLRNSPSTLFAPQGHGVRFNGNASGILFQDNDIRNNQGEGVQLQGGNLSNLQFVDNRITGNALAAAENQGVLGLRWSNNTVSGNGVDNQLVSTKVAISAASRLSDPDVFSDQQLLNQFPAIGESLRVVFGSTDPVETFDHVLWDFGDGVPSTDPDASHAYSLPGTYHITRIGWDAAGQTWIDEADVTVVPEPTAGVFAVSLALLLMLGRSRSVAVP